MFSPANLSPFTICHLMFYHVNILLTDNLVYAKQWLIVTIAIYYGLYRASHT